MAETPEKTYTRDQLQKVAALATLAGVVAGLLVARVLH
jgi:hypothetical protein